MLYVIGLGMILVGDYRSALFTVGLVVFNAAIGVAQEVRAKRELDRIALLARAKVNVLRDGQQQAIDPAELVQGDVVALQPGDQIPVDGVLLSEDRLEVDESQLTGESDLVAKTKGEALLSGSFCVTGAGLAEATQVGEASFANKLTADARKFQTIRTPLQREINRLLRVLILLVAFLMLLTALDAIVFSVRFGVFLNISSVITGHGVGGAADPHHPELLLGRHPHRPTRRPGAADQCRRVVEQRHRAVHRQDRHIDCEQAEISRCFSGRHREGRVGETAGRFRRQRRGNKQDRPGDLRRPGRRETLGGR